jgi:hypothetical protein
LKNPVNANAPSRRPRIRSTAVSAIEVTSNVPRLVSIEDSAPMSPEMS